MEELQKKIEELEKRIVDLEKRQPIIIKIPPQITSQYPNNPYPYSPLYPWGGPIVWS